MECYYRDHHISAKAELDLESDRFRAVIVIKSIIVEDHFGRRLRHPEKGIFLSDGAAELYGMVLPRNWIDRITSEIDG
jgi:hypothetical protein